MTLTIMQGTHRWAESEKVKRVLNAANKSFVVIEKSNFFHKDLRADMLIDIAHIQSVEGAVENENGMKQPRIRVRYHRAYEQSSDAVLLLPDPGPHLGPQLLPGAG